ncbi:hypothetical protein [Zhouia amylolytica]|uniref:Uncharacterized protein n=1 Tax=Zhouia amylolytica AD3 TaxID=1286632 RepID=W2ULF7_9FLAO|nr:hypothetical protein [Zhouia amylolytica]ETN94167.1 hypothetical protein P278_29710 [Zhouia amylolytica AD3]
MKIAAILFVIITSISMTCDSLKTNQESVTGFQYETYTRGSQYKIIITSNRTLVRQTGLNSFQQELNTPESKWNELMQLVRKVSLDELSAYKPQSSGRSLDAAPHATLEVLTADKNYKSSTFDHGNPPTEIESLVKAILTLAETVEKQ